MLCDARAGVNATRNEIRDPGLLIKPLLEQGQSLNVICQNHPEIKVSERSFIRISKTVYFRMQVLLSPVLAWKRKYTAGIQRTGSPPVCKASGKLMSRKPVLSILKYCWQTEVVNLYLLLKHQVQRRWKQTYTRLLLRFHVFPQKGSLGKVHPLLRGISPDKTDLYAFISSLQKKNVPVWLTQYAKSKLQ